MKQFTKLNMMVANLRNYELYTCGIHLTPSVAASLDGKYKMCMPKMKAALVHLSDRSYENFKVLQTRTLHCTSVNEFSDLVTEEGQQYKHHKKRLITVKLDVPLQGIRQLSYRPDRLVHFLRLWDDMDYVHQPAFHLANDLEGTQGVFDGNMSPFRWWSANTSDGLIRPLTLTRLYTDMGLQDPDLFWP